MAKAQKVQPTAQAKLHGSFIMETAGGTVHVANSKFVTPKALGLIKVVLDGFSDGGHGISTIMFRDDGHPVLGEDELTTWAYFPDTQTVVCNMRDLVENAFAITRRHEEEKTIYIGLRTLIWKGLIEGFCHELHHCQGFLTGELTRESNDEVKKEAEEEANQYAIDMMVKLAKTVDVEIDLGEKLEELLAEFWQEEFDEAAESGEKKDEKWADAQSLMMDKGWTYHIDKDPELDGKSVTLDTMKEYLAWSNGASLDDEEWSLDTGGILQEVVEEPIKPVYTREQAQMVNNGDADLLCDEEMYEEANAMAETPGMQGTTQFGTPQTMGFQQPQYTQPAAAPQQGNFQPPVQQVQTQPQQQNMGFQPTQQATAPQAGGNMPAGFQPPPVQQAQNPAAVVPGVGTYPPHNHDMQTVLRAFYEKCFVQIFTKCGWDGMTFTNKMAVREQIHLTPAECDIVKHMVMQDDMGTYKTAEVQGWVSGKFMDKEQLMPGFELTLAAPDGSAIIRKLVPQNPNKQSKPAELARQGWCIMWIIDDEAKAKGKPGVRMAYVPNQGVFIQQYNPGARTWDNVC